MTRSTAVNMQYPHGDDGRDLRIDFLRGLIMVYVIIVHFEYFSLFSMFAWERLAIISSAEGFVFLSGIVVGMVYQRRLLQKGLWDATRLLWQRAFKLYRVNVYMIISIILLGLLPFVNTHEVTHWTQPWSGESFALFPPPGTDFLTYLGKILCLRIGPHQYQVIGLYVVLLAFAPLALLLLSRGQGFWLLLLSWGLYALNYWLHLRITGARFELAFPSLTWQLIFFHGMAIGYYRQQILGYLVSARGRWLFVASLLLSVAFFLLSANNERILFWPWGHLDWISQETYNRVYQYGFDKTRLGLGRIMNNAVLFIVAYVLLTRYWRRFESLIGWLLIPLGQNSLYVFTLHVYLLLLLSNTPFPGMNNFWVNTLLHLAVIMLVWGMVKRRLLFHIIPR